MNRLLGLLFAVSIAVVPALGQEEDVWEPLRFFSGQWEGQGEGKGGISKGVQHFEFILGGQYLHVRNRTVFEPQEENPKGEVHQDWGFFSYDRARKTFVLRQFHVEGFVNQYVMDTPRADSKTLVFTSESIENIPSGFRARLTYRILNDHEFEQTFDLASPGQQFDCYSKGIMKRVAAQN